MKKYCIIIMLLNCLLCSGQTPFLTSKVEKKTNEGNTLERAFYDKNNEIARIYYDKDGNRINITGSIPDNVIVKSFYEDGKIEREATYKNNVYNGKINFYYENGNLQESDNYVNGVQDGESRIYFENGQINIIGFYKNDKREGFSTIYYESGIKHYEANFVNDLLEGLIKQYDENGILQYAINYKSNVLDGEYKEFYTNGKVKVYTVFENGIEIHDKAQYYDEMGKLLPPIICVNAQTYASDYDNNEVAADLKYRDKLIEIEGLIMGIKKSISDEIYIELETDNMFIGVDCYLANGQEVNAVNYIKGQKIILRGIGDKKMISPKLKECVIITK